MINLESKREALRQRIQNNDINYTNEDIILFAYYPELRREYIEKVKEDYNFINEATEEFVVSCFFEGNLNLDDAEKKQVCRSLILYGLYKSPRFKTDYVTRLPGYLQFSEEATEEMSELWKKAFADPNFTIKYLDINDEVINLLLDYKRYDILATVEPDEKAYIIGLSLEAIDRLEKEFPRDKYPFPSRLTERIYFERPTDASELEKDDFYNIRGFADLLSRCSWLSSFSYNTQNMEDEEAKKKVEEQIAKAKERLVDVIFSVIETTTSLAEYSDDYRMSNIEDIIPEDRKIEYFRLIFSKNCYRDAFTIGRSDEGVALVKSQIEMIMANNGNISSKLFNALSFNDYNDELIDYLIEHGELDCIFDSFSFGNPLKESEYAIEQTPKEIDRVNRIIQKIKNLDPAYLPYIETISLNYSNYPEILDAILSTGRVKTVHLSIFDYNDSLKETVYKYIREHPGIELTRIPYDIDEELISLFVETGNIERLIEGTYGGRIYDSPALQDYLVNNLDNLSIVIRVINSIEPGNLQSEKMWQFLLSNELITSFFIKRINDDPRNLFEEIYTPENAKRFLDFFIYKYKINPEHYNRMVDKFGGNIIRYISNETIQKLINLNDEEFEKILNIFPDTTFEMVDVEAAYDSIVQQMFSEKHPVISDLYALFIQALDNNDLDLVNKLKEIIIINTKTDFLIQTIEKFKLPQTEDTEVLVNHIISEYKKGNKDYAKKILHDLTNDIILNKRKEYRNGHHFADLYPDDAIIFESLLRAIEENNQEKIVEIVSTIIPYLNKGFYKKFKANKDIPQEYEDPKVLLVKLIEKVKDPSKRNKYLPMLKEITDYYIYRKQEEHHSELEIGAELSLPYDLEERSSRNALIKYLIKNAHDFEIHDANYNPYSFGARQNLKEVITKKLTELGMTQDEITEVFNYLNNPKQVAPERVPIAQSNISKLIKTATKIISENLDVIHWISQYIKVIPEGQAKILEEMDQQNEIARRYTKPEIDLDIYQLLSELNIDVIRKSVINNEVVYQKLISVLQKRKLTKLPDCLKELIKQANISDDYVNIASFISFFATILEEEEQRLNAAGKNPDEALTSLAQILKKAEAFSSLSSVYSQVLGPEDARLVKSNPPDNAAHAKTENNQRLNEAVELTLKNFQRQEVTVPPFDQDIIIQTSEGPKKINAVVGNFTHPANITMGERTGACMRIGGAGETLFNFCLGNKNGFHIRFEDPETHEFISRVSGFRNGNTVFLNQLRHSVLPKKYSDNDLIKYAQEVARLLIELSKNSPCPIENVVINDSYALETTDLPHQDLGVPNVKEGFPTFYSDVDSHVIVLATTATDKPFVPVNLDKSRVPTYQPCRAKVQALTDTSKLMSKINRVYSVKKMLNGTKLEDLDSIKFPNGIIYGIVSDDWYIYVDRNYEILFDYIDIDPRAKEELVTNLQKVEEMIAKKEIRTDEYGLR